MSDVPPVSEWMFCLCVLSSRDVLIKFNIFSNICIISFDIVVSSSLLVNFSISKSSIPLLEQSFTTGFLVTLLQKDLI